ncbi:helix-turn-helix domain-containing protein, partial [Dysosmobacter welbionis]
PDTPGISSPRADRSRRMIVLVKARARRRSGAVRFRAASTASMLPRASGTLVPKLTHSSAFFMSLPPFLPSRP